MHKLSLEVVVENQETVMEKLWIEKIAKSVGTLA